MEELGTPQSNLNAPPAAPAPSSIADTASDLLRQSRRGLGAFFAPKGVAVIGATEDPDSVGVTIVRNLISSPFGGLVFPVTTACEHVQGIRAYPSLHDLPDRVDLAVIATPAETIPDYLRQCGEVGVEAAIVASAGFRERAGQASDDKDILQVAREARVRMLGPSSLGVMCTATGLNATFAPSMALRGSVAFLSQSNALATAVLNWSLTDLVGFSAFVSVGNMADVGWGDLIDYFGNDPSTRAILIYMESIGDARAFLSAAREVALSKPIIVIKTGRTPAAAEASLLHTGAPPGNDEVLNAAFRRCGVLRVDKVADLFYMAEVLAKQPRPRGPNLTIVSNAGGPGVIAADTVAQYGGKLARLTDETVAAMDAAMPAAWSRTNPVDILGDAEPERYARAVELVGADEQTDGVVVILTAQALTDPTQTAEALRPYAKLRGKPILAAWMGGAEVAAGISILNNAGIPTYPYPDSAARAFCYMWQYAYNLRGIYETPTLAPDLIEGGPDREKAAAVVLTARAMGRTLLTWAEAERILTSYGIRTVENLVATEEEQAVRYARAVGYPVVMKAIKSAVTQETGLRGVQINLVNSDAVRKAFRAIRDAVVAASGEKDFLGVAIQRMIRRSGYEVVLASQIDPQFGPVICISAGGRLGKALQDRAYALPPLTATLARRMLEQTRVYAAFLGEHGDEPVDLAALEDLIVRFSYLVVEQRWIHEIIIDPLLVSAEGAMALGARVTLVDPSVREEDLPRLSIRPYPVQYAGRWTMRDGTEVLIRPIRPEDEPLIVEFHQNLSDQSVYMRYFHAMKLSQRVAHERLIRICFNDYDREIALVAEHRDPETGQVRVLGVARLSKIHGTNESEFSLLVNDQYHGLGLGTELLRRLIEVARDEKLSCIKADILPENYPMQHVCEKLGFKLRRTMDADMVKARIDL